MPVRDFAFGRLGRLVLVVWLCRALRGVRVPWGGVCRGRLSVARRLRWRVGRRGVWLSVSLLRHTKSRKQTDVGG